MSDEGEVYAADAETKPTGFKIKKVIVKRMGAGPDDFTCEIQDEYSEYEEDDKVKESEKVKNILKKVNCALQKNKEQRKVRKSSVFVFCYKKKKVNICNIQKGEDDETPSTSSAS